MKKLLLIWILCAVLPIVGWAQTPHPVLGELVFQANGEAPADEIVSFEAFLSGDIEEIRTDDSLGCAYESGVWTVECANFETAWQPGDTLFVEFFITGITETYTDEIILTNAAYDNAGITYITQMASETVAPSLEKSLDLNFYPNPFNPDGWIQFALPQAGKADVAIFNAKGQLVRRYPQRVYEAGEHQLHWNGTTQAGKQVASGVYFVRIKSDDFQASKKVVLLK